MSSLFFQWNPASSMVFIIALGSVVVLALDALLGVFPRSARGTRRRGIILMALATVFIMAAVSSVGVSESMRSGQRLAVAGMTIVGLLAIPSLWMSSTYLMAARLQTALYVALFLASLCGAFMAMSSSHLVLTWLGLEFMALPCAFLVGFDRDRPIGREANTKLRLATTMPSAVLLLGIVLVFFATGQLDYDGIRMSLEMDSPLDATALTLLLAGLLLKCGLFPFHQWMPDIDDVSPLSVMIFKSVCMRFASIIVLLMIVTQLIPEPTSSVTTLFAILAMLGSVIGGLMAIAQSSIKRLISWAGVGQGGILLLAFGASTSASYGALLLYLIAIGLATLGALSVILVLNDGGRRIERAQDLAGFGRSNPVLAALLTLFLASLSGLPITAGFWAKWFLAWSAIEAGQGFIVLVVLIASVLMLYAYMRLVSVLYMRDSVVSTEIEPSTSELAVLLVCAGLTLWMGLMPEPILTSLTGGALEGLRERAFIF